VSTPAVIVDDADWVVPSHEAALYAQKAHKYALVIPVINEGERIRGQLSRIKDAQLPVDVIVADGGSSDGSLDADFVQPIGVRAVLTKTGPGKLSAQLRMAYAWCLREGYDGIVTIDGNGKDGVEAVAQFVAKLDEGCDYVQGSRYLRGGEAENTPLERTIANRLIHAPLLSIAGRHWFTDTTNGFRAYSARYLTHPDVRPFRAEFEVYNLLFYLTVRAGQLGLKVDHVPVVRRYPDSGKVPTKIGGLSSKIALLGETVQAATGGYTPDSAPRSKASLGWPALVAALVLLPLLLSVVASPNYSPDSWAFYELSKTVFADFYRFSHFRSYASASEYSSAFAPLWPTLIALVDGALGTGARTGLYLAFLSFFGFVLVSERLGQSLVGARWLGTGLALLLLLAPKMVWDELGAGRTIPLQLLLYGMVLLGLTIGRTMSLLRAAGIGLVAALAVMNRFDGAFLPIFTTAAVFFVTRSPAHTLAAFAASLAAVSPWVGYSLSTFGTVFATDNSSVATALDARAFVTDWWPEAQPSVVDDPASWVAKVLCNVGQWGVNGLALLLTPLGFAMALAVVLVGVVQWFAAKAPVHGKTAGGTSRHFALLFVFIVFLALSMIPQIVTGYLEYRYYAGLIWGSLFGAAMWHIERARTLRQRQTFASIYTAAIGVFVLGFVAAQLVSAANLGRLENQLWAQFDSPEDVAQLSSCIGTQRQARILVLGDDKFAAKAGALGSLRTMMEPRNMAEGRLDPEGKAAFLDQWEVEYVLVRDEEREQDASELPGFAKADDCGLTLLRRNSQDSPD
jgi:glycosyltransferase involved in cell wall biosynthesis